MASGRPEVRYVLISDDQIEQVVSDLLGTKGDIDFSLEEFTGSVSDDIAPGCVNKIMEQIFQCDQCFTWRRMDSRTQDDNGSLFCERCYQERMNGN